MEPAAGSDHEINLRMEISGATIRRATLDDLDNLRGLWREFRLPEYDLERRFTEFQVAVDPRGWILGALGLRFLGVHGQVHSLAIRRADMEFELTAGLWERILALANQHGTHRLWTHQHGPFWTGVGFVEATPEDRRTLPPAMGDPKESWWTLKIRDEPLKLVAAEEQLAAYLELERLKSERLMRRGQVLKIAATTFAAVLFFIVLAALFLLLRGRPKKSR